MTGRNPPSRQWRLTLRRQTKIVHDGVGNVKLHWEHIERTQRNAALQREFFFTDEPGPEGAPENTHMTEYAANEPQSFTQAIASSESTKWVKAMNMEMDSMKKNDVWEVIDRPKH